MGNSKITVLNQIEEMVASLSEEDLKSKAAIIKRIYPYIVKAQGLGYAHNSIFRAIISGGLKMDIGTYQVTLYRYKQRIKNGKEEAPIEAILTTNKKTTSTESITFETVAHDKKTLDTLQVEEQGDVEKAKGVSSVTKARDTLTESSEKLAKKNYADLARPKKTRTL